MPSFGDILIRVVTTDAGLEFLHAALYIDTPSHFEKYIPPVLLKDTPPSTSSGATEKDVMLYSLVKDILPKPLRADKPYIIHFSGDLDAMAPTDENSEKTPQRQIAGYDLNSIFSMLSSVSASRAPARSADGSEESPTPGEPLIKVALYEQEFDESCDRITIHKVIATEPTIRSAEETVREAFQHMGTGFGKYHVLANNCQHFVTACKYNRAFLLPEQVDMVKDQITSVKDMLFGKFQEFASSAVSSAQKK